MALLPEDPGDGVDDVGFAAPVGADNAGDGTVEDELRPIGKTFEPLLVENNF